MKIGIFGGAFNPPHIGHINAAKNAAVDNKLDLLLIIPTGTSPHKPMPECTPKPELRLKMTQDAFNNMPVETRVLDIEIYSKQSNYTIDTIKTLQKEYKDAKFFLLVGNDMYDSLDTWKDSTELKRLVKPVLLPRDVIDISSTQIRGLLAQREGVEYLNNDTYALIIRNGLYNAKPSWDWLRKTAYAMLEPTRISHVAGCEKAAVKLAQRWGEDIDDARTAAILHDITKKLDFDENMCIIENYRQVTNDYKKNEAKLLHSVTAALVAKNEFNVSDKVARAIRLHTTGDIGMSMLDKIIYIADYIEETRDMPGVEELRKAAFEDIDKAIILGLQMAIDDLTSRDIPVNEATINALDDLTGSKVP